MVQKINNSIVNSYGSINKIGTRVDGRVVYQVVDPDGKEAAKITIPEADCDKFEKSYNTILKTAPKIQEFAQNHSSPEELKKRRKTSNWTIALSTLICGGIPLFGLHKGGNFVKALATIGGTFVGLIGGFNLASILTSPPGTMKFAKATKNISKIDIQPLEQGPQMIVTEG